LIPALSVLLPIRDAAPYLSQTITSLRCQTFEDFEVIAVDDGSEDSTPRLLSEWAREDPRVRILSTGKRGLVPALSAGLEACRGRLLARMDGDDIAMPSRFAEQSAFLSTHPEVRVLGSRCRLFPRSRLHEGMRRYERWLNAACSPADIRRELFVESPLCHPTVMAYREDILAAGGYIESDEPEDYDLWLRLASRGLAMAKLPQTLLLWRDRPLRATRTDPRYAREAVLRLKARHLVEWGLPSRRDVGIWGSGPLGKRWGKALRALGLEPRLFVDIDPRKIGGRVAGAPVISPDELGSPGEPFLLAAVGAEGARDEIRGRLTRRGWHETVHFRCVQ